MGEIVNLRMARKRKARDERDKTASANRAAHGMTKSERDRNAAERRRATSNLDGHLLDPDGKTPG
ncbi:MAG: DUF4169 family protein [Phyllobacteriaceae bacterium]|nr:DUF4169 family protein [Phyllobacteriaceae bacterium]